MPVYTIHAPLSPRAGARSSDDMTLVRDGFHFWAFVFGPLWLLWHRLWLAFLGFIALLGLIEVAGRFGLNASGRASVQIVLLILLGVEAASLLRFGLSRRNWQQVDVVVAPDEDSAMQRFLDRSAGKVEPPLPPLPATFAAPAPGSNEIVGLFPQPGGLR